MHADRFTATCAHLEFTVESGDVIIVVDGFPKAAQIRSVCPFFPCVYEDGISTCDIVFTMLTNPYPHVVIDPEDP